MAHTQADLDAIKAANYNLDQKNPHVGEQASHDPDVLLADHGIEGCRSVAPVERGGFTHHGRGPV